MLIILDFLFRRSHAFRYFSVTGEKEIHKLNDFLRSIEKQLIKEKGAHAGLKVSRGETVNTSLVPSMHCSNHRILNDHE